MDRVLLEKLIGLQLVKKVPALLAFKLFSEIVQEFKIHGKEMTERAVSFTLGLCLHFVS